MRPSLRASWRAHPPRSPPLEGKIIIEPRCEMFLLAFATIVTIPPQKRNKSTLFLKKMMFPLPNSSSSGKIVSVLLAVFFPTIGVPDGDHGYAHPYLFTYSLILQIDDFKLVRMFQIKLSNLVFCTNQDNVDDKASPTGLVVLALCIWLTHNQANRWICKRSSFSKILL